MCHMNQLAERIGQWVFPEKVRRYLTFRSVTIVVVVLAICNLAIGILYKPYLSPEGAAQIRNHRLAHSPAFLALHAIVLAVGFWVIYRTRKKKQYYWLRVVFYGMLIGGLVGEILDLVLALRS
jgi:hypothetical protein